MYCILKIYYGYIYITVNIRTILNTSIWCEIYSYVKHTIFRVHAYELENQRSY